MVPPTSTPTVQPTCRALGDQDDPVVLLCDRGIMEANKASPHALVNALKSSMTSGRMTSTPSARFGLTSSLPSPSCWMKPYRKKALKMTQGRPVATQGDLKRAVDSIKAAIGPSPSPQGVPFHLLMLLDLLPSSLRTATSRSLPSTEAQEKEIFILTQKCKSEFHLHHYSSDGAHQ